MSTAVRAWKTHLQETDHLLISILDFGSSRVFRVRMSEEQTVSLVDVLEEDQELEEEASAVLGGSDSDHCSYPQVGDDMIHTRLQTQCQVSRELHEHQTLSLTH